MASLHFFLEKAMAATSLSDLRVIVLGGILTSLLSEE